MSLRIIIADDHKIVRDTIRTALMQSDRLDLVGDAEDGHEVLKLVEKIKPDIVLMDISMPGLNGVEATQRIVMYHPDIKVIALSAYYDKHYVIAMLNAGAHGFVPKSSSFDELVTAIECVKKGDVYLSPAISKHIIDFAFGIMNFRENKISNKLSNREKEVLQLVAEGKTSKEIGTILSLSKKTVDTHRNQIMSKTGIRSIAELTKYAIRIGITSVEH